MEKLQADVPVTGSGPSPPFPPAAIVSLPVHNRFLIQSQHRLCIVSR
jgi:hypothetical protein